MTQNTDTSDAKHREMNTRTVETSTEVTIPDELLADARERASRFDENLGVVLRNHVYVRLSFRDADGDVIAEW